MQICNTVNTVSVVDIHMCHVYQTVFDNIGAFIGNFCTYTVVQLADNWHKLWNCLIQETDWPFLKCLCKNRMVGVCTYLRYDGNCLIHQDASLL